jgi:hypothetical protein
MYSTILYIIIMMSEIDNNEFDTQPLDEKINNEGYIYI